MRYGDFAGAVGVGKSAVWRMLKGYLRPSRSVQDKICKLTGLDVDTLMSGFREPPLRVRLRSHPLYRVVDGQGISVDTLSKMLGITYASLRGILGWTQTPSYSLARKMATLAGVHTRDCLGDLLPSASVRVSDLPYLLEDYPELFVRKESPEQT